MHSVSKYMRFRFSLRYMFAAESTGLSLLKFSHLIFGRQLDLLKTEQKKQIFHKGAWSTSRDPYKFWLILALSRDSQNF